MFLFPTTDWKAMHLPQNYLALDIHNPRVWMIAMAIFAVLQLIALRALRHILPTYKWQTQDISVAVGAIVYGTLGELMYYYAPREFVEQNDLRFPAALCIACSIPFIWRAQHELRLMWRGMPLPNDRSAVAEK